MINSDHNISDVPGDIIGAHILPRLDGVSLSSFISASSEFRSVGAINERRLWRHVTTSTWPSTIDPRVQRFITSLPRYHRGFFTESFPLLTGHVISDTSRSILTDELISAVDIYYKNEPVFSRVRETETGSSWFKHSPFRVDLLGPKESFRVRTGPGRHVTDLAENLKLSWIIIDPIRRTTANLSSFSAVATERHWLTGEISVKYATVVRVDRGQRAVEVEVKGVTCSGEMHVREVGMRVEDMEGKWLNGKGSLGILVSVMEHGVRRIDQRGFRGRERYDKYLEMKRVYKEEKERRERNVGMAYICGVVFVLVGFYVGCSLVFL